ncbi:phage tail protein [Trichocoleus sp. DQ-A3]|uniref:phage tail protein n=1 Tax=Cyanophyceae TaxID=3028117 RepID=UPI0016832309|nr:phage tail protein [Coleofasciculus sp. FACHB-125]MBD1903821.1 hypothetical protein [Coleofasciculus sp. FACHB-125]
MAKISSYTKYLPSILWSSESDPSQFLGRMLCIFEQLLTGITIKAPLVTAAQDRIRLKSAADASNFSPGDLITISAIKNIEAEGKTERVPVIEQVEVKSVREAEIFLAANLRDTYSEGIISITDTTSLEKTIDHLPEVFNPWRTPTKFLPWLASWLALSLQDDWTEYQRRKIISQIISIYQQRGLKQGLLTYLDIYVANKANPRIAIDDGEAVFRAQLTSDRMTELHAIAYSHAVGDRGVLLHPTAIAVDRENNYIVADAGGQEQGKTWLPALWKLSSTGEIQYTGGLPQHIYSDNKLRNPIAVVIDNQNQYYVLVQGDSTKGDKPTIYRFTSGSTEPTRLIEDLKVFDSVDMVLDTSANQKRLIILDRGNPSDTNKIPKLVFFNEGSPPKREEQVLKLKNSVELTEVTALVIDSSGDLIVANARDPNSQEPADIIRLNHQDWSPIYLTQEVKKENNPLIYPTSLVFENSQSLLVCDTGVRGSSGSERTMAEPADIYRIDLSHSPPSITKITNNKKLVNPTKMAIDQKGELVIADQGEANKNRDWRARSNEFGVVVLFSAQRSTNENERNKIRFEIEKVINDQKPAQTFWSMKSVVD